MATMKKPAKKYADGGPITTTTKTTKKPKTASQRIGDLTLRDVKNSAETATNILTLGGYGAVKKGVKKLTGMKSGGTMKKAQSGTAIKQGVKGMSENEKVKKGITKLSPIKKTMKDGGSLGMKSVKAGVDKNPGVTRADIITAATKKAKSGAKMKKCKSGCY